MKACGRWSGGRVAGVVCALVVAAAVVPAVALQAQQKRTSPHETISQNFGGSRVMVVYGRPYTKDPKTGEKRKIWGGVVPFGKVWRMGADESTLLVTEQPLKFGETTVPAGAYSLFMWPNEDGTAKLIINKTVGAWGAYTYKEDQDLVRVDMKKDTVDPAVDQFTITIPKEGDTGGMIKATWDTESYSVPFTVVKQK